MQNILKHYTQSQIEKASKITCIITDVDGVLTDGGITYDESGMEFKKFHARDGLIVGFLKKAGILVGAISGRESMIVQKRCSELGFDFLYQNAKDKIPVYAEIRGNYTLTNEQMAYIGDDLLDLPLIAEAGLGVTPSDAHNYIQKRADLVTLAKGGQGVFRELADLVLASTGEMEKIIAQYGDFQRTG